MKTLAQFGGGTIISGGGGAAVGVGVVAALAGAGKSFDHFSLAP